MNIFKTIAYKLIGLSGSGIWRSPEKAIELANNQIMLGVRDINASIKQSGMVSQIEKEKIKLSEELQSFKKAFQNNELDIDYAVDRILQIEKKYEELDQKIEELNSVSSSIKNRANEINQNDEDFNKEMKELGKITLKERQDLLEAEKIWGR